MIGLVVVGILSGIAGLVAYRCWLVPHRKLADLEWLENASAAERRDVAHWVIRWEQGAHHDAFILLTDCGNAKSIPLLIRALRWYPSSDGVMVCTKGHCLDALRTITGHNAGISHEAWAKWWDATGRHYPPEAFPLKAPVFSSAQADERAE